MVLSRYYFTLLTVGLSNFTNALTLTVVFAFAGEMVHKHYKMVESASEAGYYAGFVVSAFYFGRVIGNSFWGTFADKHGRKPCLIIGFVSMIIFNLMFGVSPSLQWALLARFLGGITNPIGSMSKVIASELEPKSKASFHITVVTTCWLIGNIIGPGIGGFCSHKFTESFPYLLPMLIISFFSTVCIVLAFFSIPETLTIPKKKFKYVELELNHNNNAKSSKSSATNGNGRQSEPLGKDDSRLSEIVTGESPIINSKQLIADAEESKTDFNIMTLNGDGHSMMFDDKNLLVSDCLVQAGNLGSEPKFDIDIESERSLRNMNLPSPKVSDTSITKLKLNLGGDTPRESTSNVGEMTPSRRAETESTLQPGANGQQNASLRRMSTDTGKKSVSWTALLANRELRKALLSYALLTMAITIFYEVLCLWCYARIDDGGLGFGPTDIGIVLMFAGGIALGLQFLVSPLIKERLGIRRGYRLSLILMAVITVLLPNLSIFTQVKISIVMWTLLIITIVIRGWAAQMCSSSIVTIIGDLCELTHRAKANSATMTIGICTRAVGPATGASLFAWATNSGYIYPLNYQFIFIINGIICLSAILAMRHLPDEGEKLETKA